MNSVVLLLVSCLVEPDAAAPLGKEQYPMPPSVLQGKGPPVAASRILALPE